MGIILGLFCHFILRDHLIGFFEKIIHWQNESKGLLNFTKERSDDPEQSPDDPTKNETGLEEVLKYTLSGQAKDDKEFSSCKFMMICFLLWLAVIAGGTVSFFIWKVQLSKESLDIVLWSQNL